MKLYLALNKYLSSDSLLAGNSRRSLGFISVNAKSKRKSELTSPSSTCTQANACAYAQTPGLAFRNRRTSHESCAGKLSRLAVPGQTYFCMDVPHSTFKDFITPSQVQKEYYTFDICDTWCHLLQQVHFKLRLQTQPSPLGFNVLIHSIKKCIKVLCV